MELDIKRFYIPFDLNPVCPFCHKENILKQDTHFHYLSYPDTEKKQFLYWCCQHCDEDLEMLIDFDIKFNAQYCTVKAQ